jgi:hypothetical protein
LFENIDRDGQQADVNVDEAHKKTTKIVPHHNRHLILSVCENN